MSQTIRCDHCGNQVDADEAAQSHGHCRQCGKPLDGEVVRAVAIDAEVIQAEVVHAELIAPATPAEPERVEPKAEPEPEPAPPTLLDELDDELAVEAFAHFDQAFKTKGSANTRLIQWKRQLSKVESVYKPSGSLPAPAILSMAGGLPVAITAAVLCEATVSVASAAVIGLIIIGNMLGIVLGFIYFILVILLFIGTVLALAAPFWAGGWGASKAIHWFGRWGKNRSPNGSGAFAAGAAAASVPIFGLLFALLLKPTVDSWELLGIPQTAQDIIYLVIGGFGIGVAAWSGWHYGKLNVVGDKFCETCDFYMKRERLKMLNAEALRVIVHALKNEQHDLAFDALELPADKLGELLLFYCPSCSAGYAEAHAHFKATYYEKKPGHFFGIGTRQAKETLNEEWLAASVNLNEEQVSDFRAWHVEAKSRK